MSERWTPAYDRMFKTDHEFAGEPACRRWAWLDICHQARFDDGNRIVRGTLVPLKRGELVASYRFLAQRWSWSVKKVRMFMETLTDPSVQKLKQVRETPQGTVYAVVLYDVYANPGHSESHDKGTGRAQVGHKEQHIASSTTVRPRAKNHALPDSWQPTEDHEEIAAELHLNLSDQVTEFRDHAKANGRTQKDWDASFRNWMRNSVKFAKKNGTPNHNRNRQPDWKLRRPA